jgi:hypothetical protein
VTQQVASVFVLLIALADKRDTTNGVSICTFDTSKAGKLSTWQQATVTQQAPRETARAESVFVLLYQQHVERQFWFVCTSNASTLRRNRERLDGRHQLLVNEALSY